jgi:hypothetical protein
MKQYKAPALAEYGDVAVLTGFSGNATQQDVIFTPNGNFGFPGPASEFACQIPSPNANQCM